MPDAPLSVNDNSNGIADKIVVSVFRYLWAPFRFDVVHFFVPNAFALVEFFASIHNGQVSTYDCGYEYGCYNPANMIVIIFRNHWEIC